MIKGPPTFFDIKEGITSSYKFMTKKDTITNLYTLNDDKFWESCWIVFFVNALVSAMAPYGIQTTFEVNLQSNLLPKLLIITIIDI